MNEGLLDGPLRRGVVRAAVRARRRGRRQDLGGRLRDVGAALGGPGGADRAHRRSARACSTSATATARPTRRACSTRSASRSCPTGRCWSRTPTTARSAGTPTARSRTIATDLAEPSGLLVLDGGSRVVVESAAHRLTRLAAARTSVGSRTTARTAPGGPSPSCRPARCGSTSCSRPATGQKYDDRYGPSTRLQVSSTPPGLLLDGAGDDVPLDRVLRLDPSVPEGVLHVTAHAASCDADPAIEYPACHLNAQDWGVPVRLVEGARDDADPAAARLSGSSARAPGPRPPRARRATSATTSPVAAVADIPISTSHGP